MKEAVMHKFSQNEDLLQPAYGADYFKFEVEPFVEFLKNGISEYKKR